MVKKECRVRIHEEGPKVSFAVLVADVANEIKGCVVAIVLDLLQAALDHLVALVVAVREQEQDHNVHKALLDFLAQLTEETVGDNVLQVAVDLLI